MKGQATPLVPAIATDIEGLRIETLRLACEVALTAASALKNETNPKNDPEVLGPRSGLDTGHVGLLPDRKVALGPPLPAAGAHRAHQLCPAS